MALRRQVEELKTEKDTERREVDRLRAEIFSLQARPVSFAPGGGEEAARLREQLQVLQIQVDAAGDYKDEANSHRRKAREARAALKEAKLEAAKKMLSMREVARYMRMHMEANGVLETFDTGVFVLGEGAAWKEL